MEVLEILLFCLNSFTSFVVFGTFSSCDVKICARFEYPDL